MTDFRYFHRLLFRYTGRMISLHEKRMDVFKKAGLYLVTSEGLSAGRSSIDIVKAALDAGVQLFQLREKDFSSEKRLDYAQQMRALTDDYGALLIINDDPSLAAETGADGVHLGQADGNPAIVRAEHPDLIIGVSTHNSAEALQAEKDGASYINIGPVYPTETKQWDDAFLGVEKVEAISMEVSLPFTVMGGIKKSHIPELCAIGCRTIALVTAVTAADDPCLAAKELLSGIYAARSE